MYSESYVVVVFGHYSMVATLSLDVDDKHADKDDGYFTSDDHIHMCWCVCSYIYIYVCVHVPVCI